MIPAKQRQIVEALRTEHSVRDICGVLGIPRSTLSYQPKLDPYEAALRTRIEQLAATYRLMAIDVSRSCWRLKATPLDISASPG